MARRRLTRWQSKKSFKKGSRVRRKNKRTRIMRGGYRI